jgi:hypothetical protein
MLASREQFNALPHAPEVKINDLSQEFDALLARMQGAEVQKAMQAAFNASPKKIGKAAVQAAVRMVWIAGAIPSSV